MSKNIVIQEGGIGKQLTANKLKTNLVGGGTCNWVPEDETQVITKSITKNGTYKASSDGAYGYSKVVVNVAGGSVTGKGADGNTHTYSVDDQGNIVDEKVPDSISITTPPSFVGPYGDRAYISFDGLVVHAYDSTGQDMGEVPFEELIFPVTIAEYDPDAPLYTEAYQADFFDEPVITTDVFRVELLGTDIYRPSQPVWDKSFETKTGYNKMAYYGYVPAPSAASVPPNGGHRVDVWYASYTRVNPYDVEYTYDGKTVFSWSEGSSGGDDHEWTLSPYPPAREAPNDGSNYRMQRMAWTMLYGEKTGATGGVQIPVQWQRPGDGKILETSFNITVVPIYGDSNEL